MSAQQSGNAPHWRSARHPFQITALFTWATSSLRRTLSKPRKVVIIGSETGTKDFVKEAGLIYEVVETIPIDSLADTNGVVADDAIIERLTTLFRERPIDEVFVGMPPGGSESLVRSIVSLCEEQRVTIRLIPHLPPMDPSRTSMDVIHGQPVITISGGRVRVPGGKSGGHRRTT